MLTTNKISRLTTSTSHQLEAEQVIPDLSSALKELVENSLDSNPSTITITFCNHGFDYIIVEDDGDGIQPEDMAEIASNRYATSKIVDEIDLETSLSYGFRGEALHSLVKLSRKLTIISSSNSSGSGISKTFAEFGASTKSNNKHRTKGTSVTIEGLFECISIRRQDWFKRKGFIYSQAILLLQSFAILIPNVKFCAFLVKDKTEKITVIHSSAKDMQTRYTECMKNNVKLIEKIYDSFFVKTEEILVNGILAKQVIDAGKNRIVIFLNRKPFESPKWQKHFQQMLKRNFSTGFEFFLNIELPGLWIDYNVTPDKRSIFILNESSILTEFIKICEKYLRKEVVIEATGSKFPSNDEQCIQCCDSASSESELCDKNQEFLNIGSAHSVQLIKNDIIKLKPIGQFNNGFIICSKISEDNGNSTEIFAIDQHAADERIRFEEIAANYSISCQKLVQPIRIELPVEDEDFVFKSFDIIRASGFLIRESDGNFYLDALPNFHGAESTVADFREMIEYIKDHGALYRNLCPKFHRVLASRACRSAVMIGSPLTSLQIHKILNKLSQTDYPWICAHGRPTIQFLKHLNNETQ